PSGPQCCHKDVAVRLGRCAKTATRRKPLLKICIAASVSRYFAIDGTVYVQSTLATLATLAHPITSPTGKPAMPAKKPTKTPAYRLPALTEDSLNPRQRALLDSIRSGPRGGKASLGGPFGVYLHAPEVGDLTQQLGAFCRFKTSLPPRLSEFAILVTARHWRAQYEWHAHAKIAEGAGVSARTIADLKAG